MTLAFAADRLIAITLRENAALTALDFHAATALLDAKRAAIAAFEVASKTASEPPAMDQVARLRDAAFANATLIERAIGVQRRVIDTVLAAVPQCHSAPGYRADAGLARARRAAPMALLARA